MGMNRRLGHHAPAGADSGEGVQANLREDTGDVLGIVSDEYEVVYNRGTRSEPDASARGGLNAMGLGSLC